MQLADIVLQQALPCVFVSVTYRLIDPRHGLEQRLGAFLLVAQAVAFAGASLGYLIACLSPDSEFATVVAPLFVFPMILLGGLYANVGAIPAGARWINKVNPINYGFQAVSQAQWRDYGAIDNIFRVNQWNFLLIGETGTGKTTAMNVRRGGFSLGCSCVRSSTTYSSSNAWRPG